MIELGKVQTLKVLREKEFGVYLGETEEDTGILLPKKQVPEGTKPGDEISVFVYKDSMDRVIATTKQPKIQLGEMTVLTVKEKTRIGAFLDWGLEKDLLLPFKEQTNPLRQGDSCLVRLYVDKSSRLCATMRIYDYLQPNDRYQVGDQVEGTIYRINPDMGAFVAVDNRYFGMIPNRELFDNYRSGDVVSARITQIREDGKLNLAIRDKAYLQIRSDAERILSVLNDFGGVLPFGEKADPEVIKSRMKMSKNAFKRALGHLLKEGRIETGEDSIRLIR
ncbi:MAG: S1 RNA-binding domain-containing protein [Lachnospiraceae bacterium]|nr:S1 RNA-binding domain-containing protein [Lachnospiraceae bacterium]